MTPFITSKKTDASKTEVNLFSWPVAISERTITLKRWSTSLQVQDIWKDGEFSKSLLSLLDQKYFQELVFKAFKNPDCSFAYTYAARSSYIYIDSKSIYTFKSSCKTLRKINSNQCVYFINIDFIHSYRHRLKMSSFSFKKN